MCRTLDDESTTNGYGSLLSTAYQFRPIATSHILGDLNALTQGNIEQYGKNVMWDKYSPAARIGDYFPLIPESKVPGNSVVKLENCQRVNYTIVI